MKIREKFGTVALPGWLFAACNVLFNELMLHIWVTDGIHFGRLLAVALFALGFGGVLALITSLIPGKAAKWVAVGLGAAVSVFWVTEYFISDAYQVFMTPATIIGGAGGVAEDYFGLVVSLVVRNLWRIGLLLLPTVLYALFCRCEKTGWKLRGVLAAVAAAGYLLGYAAVNGLTVDAARFSTTYDFDSAVRCFGLSMGLTLDVTHGVAPESEPSFVMDPTEPELSTGAPAESTEVQEDPAETTEATEPPVVYGYNVMEEFDFEALAEAGGSSANASLCRYVASLEPSQQNEYTGMFAGKNLILITAEAFSAEVIDPELTPTLYRLANEGIRFTEYYQPAWGASTTSGEFSNLIGLVPANGGACMTEPSQQNLFLTMGKQLQALGYHSTAYHNHVADFYSRDKTHVHLGYDQFLARYGGLEGISEVWPESDLEMMDITVPQYIDKQPFSIYYMTVSGHCIYTQKENAMSAKNYDKVADMEHSETVKCYYASQLELEAAMASLVRQLEEAGIADDTVIVLATDHYPYGLERSGTWKNTVDHLAELYGVEDYDNFLRDHNALIIWSGCLEDMDIVVDEPVYSLDILPTLSNLFGVNYDSRLLVGRDVFSDQEPIVLWPDHSWKTDKGTYNIKTDVFTPNEGVTVDEGYVERISAQVANKITYSRAAQNQNFFNFLTKALEK